MKRMILVIMLLGVLGVIFAAGADLTVGLNVVGNTWTYTVTHNGGSQVDEFNVYTATNSANITNITSSLGDWSGSKTAGNNCVVTWTAGTAFNSGSPTFQFDCPNDQTSGTWDAYDGVTQVAGGNVNVPLPVELSSFTVSFTAGQQAEVCWVTQSETGNMGWNVYRSQTDDFAEATVLNDAMIGGAGTASSPTNYSFIDEAQLIEEFTYWYWIESIDYSGETTSYDPVQFTVPQDPGQQPQPPVYHNALYQNYPNPFNPSTMIAYSLESQSDVEISIFNQRGEHVKTVMVYNAPEGNNGIEWNGTNEAGNLVSSGIYFYTIEANKFRATRKALLIK